MISKTIHIEGISSIGTKRDYNYLMLDCEKKTDCDLIKEALGWADEEYSYQWDEKREPIPNSEYKEFVQVTKIEVFTEVIED